MIVFIGGQHRSGSTFTFNIARDLLLTVGSVGQASANSLLNYSDVLNNNDHFLLKSHCLENAELRMVREGEAKMIMTKRDPLSAIASLMDTFGINRKDAFQAFLDWRCMYDCIAEHALVIEYELIETRPDHVTTQIANLLIPEIRSADIVDICNRYSKIAVMEMSNKIDREDSEVIDLGFSYFDRHTFFHRSHVASLTSPDTEARISAEDISWIRNALRSNSVVQKSGADTAP